MANQPIYDYLTPPGVGDVFYQYVYDAAALTNGNNYNQLAIFVDNYDFICRHWSGWSSILNSATTGTVQVYDSIARQWFSLPIQLGAFAEGAVVLPEKRYQVNSSIKFDLKNVLKAANGENFASQLVFTGVRRIPGVNSDPGPGSYQKYYLKSFAYQQSLTIAATPTADQLIQIPITDFDFELERVEMTAFATVSPFSITLFDSNNVARSNAPVNANRFFNFNPTASNGEQNFWPSPPILYPVNSVLRFVAKSLANAGPTTYQLLFVGNRRIPCQ